MPVGERHDGATRRGALDLRDEGVAPRRHLEDVLAAGAALAEQIELGITLEDLGGGEPFELAVVVLHQRGHFVGRVRGQRERRGVRGALQRAGVHHRHHAVEPVVDHLRRGASLVLAERGEGQIGAAGVLARGGPLGGTVTDEQDEGRQRRRRTGHGREG